MSALNAMFVWSGFRFTSGRANSGCVSERIAIELNKTSPVFRSTMSSNCIDAGRFPDETPFQQPFVGPEKSATYSDMTVRQTPGLFTCLGTHPVCRPRYACRCPRSSLATAAQTILVKARDTRRCLRHVDRYRQSRRLCVRSVLTSVNGEPTPTAVAETDPFSARKATSFFTWA